MNNTAIEPLVEITIGANRDTGAMVVVMNNRKDTTLGEAVINLGQIVPAFLGLSFKGSDDMSLEDKAMEAADFIVANQAVTLERLMRGPIDSIAPEEQERFAGLLLAFLKQKQA